MFTIKNAAILGFTLIAIIIGFDIYLAVDTIKSNTWSEMIRTFSFKSPLAPWVWGGLGGHFFHQWLPTLNIPNGGNIAILVWVSLLLFLVGQGLYIRSCAMPPQIIFFVAFFIWGILWPV